MAIIYTPSILSFTCEYSFYIFSLCLHHNMSNDAIFWNCYKQNGRVVCWEQIVQNNDLFLLQLPFTSGESNRTIYMPIKEAEFSPRFNVFDHCLRLLLSKLKFQRVLDGVITCMYIYNACKERGCWEKSFISLSFNYIWFFWLH